MTNSPFRFLQSSLILFITLVLLKPVMAASDDHQFFTTDRSRNALGHIAGSMSDGDLDRFALGRSFFTKPWVEAPAATRARDGLGPLFNANSCLACHRNHGGGEAVFGGGKVDRSIVMQIDDDPVYGSQIAINGVHGVPAEAAVHVQQVAIVYSFNDGTRLQLQKPVFSLQNQHYGLLTADSSLKPRRAPALVGLGLVEHIPAQQIMAIADPDDADADGISGTARQVWSQTQGDWRLGRFGWKATRASLLDQTATALSDDMGLTTSWFPDENCRGVQKECLQAHSGGNPEVPDARVEAIAFYLGRLKAPRSDTDHRGQRLFEQVGCNACHRRGYQTTDKVKVDPYTDFLLHDMGVDLADPELANRDRAEAAEAREWRTAPLWGIGLAKILNPRAGFLHDGRAATLEQAILWHGGEARAARVEFSALKPTQRNAIISFLESL